MRWNDDDVAAAARDGQVRVWWDETPLDLFFDYAPIHVDAAAYRRVVPFAGHDIPVLGPVELVVFKVMFDRTRHWADVEAVIAAQAVCLDAVRRSLAPMLEPGDRRWARLAEAERRAAAG